MIAEELVAVYPATDEITYERFLEGLYSIMVETLEGNNKFFIRKREYLQEIFSTVIDYGVSQGILWVVAIDSETFYVEIMDSLVSFDLDTVYLEHLVSLPVYRAYTPRQLVALKRELRDDFAESRNKSIYKFVEVLASSVERVSLGSEKKYVSVKGQVCANFNISLNQAIMILNTLNLKFDEMWFGHQELVALLEPSGFWSEGIPSISVSVDNTLLLKGIVVKRK